MVVPTTAPEAVLSPEVASQITDLLQPISLEEPCGPSLRFDPLFTDIRLAREEDDPSLPMGQWERPLKTADWESIEQRSTSFLTKRSKDLQMAAWLLEAWMRRRGLVGLLAGLQLMQSLLETHWDCVHPQIDEDGSCDGRVAPFEWLNEQLPIWLRIHINLAEIPESRPSHFTLDDWNRLTQQEIARAARSDSEVASKTSSKQDDGEEQVTRTRDDVLQAVRALGGRAQRRDLGYIRACAKVITDIDALFTAKLAAQGPSLARITEEIHKFDRALDYLCTSLGELASPNSDVNSSSGAQSGNQTMDMTGAAIPPETAEMQNPSSPAFNNGWTSREQAYRSLEAIADYLSRTEPHSPTPYLIRRAVNWGRMPLPELMAEIIREEGDLNKLVSMLGIGGRYE
jgi:type VI secretion system protein ImpA